MRQEHSEPLAQAEAGPVHAGFGGSEGDPQRVGDLGHRQLWQGLADARTANPFRLPRLHPEIGVDGGGVSAIACRSPKSVRLTRDRMHCGVGS